MTHDEIRMTSTSGAAKGSKLARFDLIPKRALEEVAVHYGLGAKKYTPVNGFDNWRNGYPWSLSLAALHRHLNAFERGEDFDDEFGSKHLAAVVWHALTLMTWMDNPALVALYDDRQDAKQIPVPVAALAQLDESKLAGLPQEVRDAVHAYRAEAKDPAPDNVTSLDEYRGDAAPYFDDENGDGGPGAA